MPNPESTLLLIALILLFAVIIFLVIMFCLWLSKISEENFDLNEESESLRDKYNDYASEIQKSYNKNKT